jgi:hypothetical protein
MAGLAGPPMTLGNMRANGVRLLDVCCLRFDHDTTVRAVSAICGQLIWIKGGDEMACTEDSLFPKEQVPASRPPTLHPSEVGTIFALAECLAGASAPMPPAPMPPNDPRRASCRAC